MEKLIEGNIQKKKKIYNFAAVTRPEGRTDRHDYIDSDQCADQHYMLNICVSCMESVLNKQSILEKHQKPTIFEMTTEMESI